MSTIIKKQIQWMKLFDGQKFACDRCNFVSFHKKSDQIRQHYKSKHIGLLPSYLIIDDILNEDDLNDSRNIFYLKQIKNESSDEYSEDSACKTARDDNKIESSTNRFNFYNIKNSTPNNIQMESNGDNKINNLNIIDDQEDVETEISKFCKIYEKGFINKINDSYLHDKNYYSWKLLFKDGKYHCNQCLFVSTSQNCRDIRYHYINEHPNALKKLEKSSSVHPVKKKQFGVMSKYKMNRIVCDLCKMKLKNVRALISHMNLHFNKLRKLYDKDHFICDRCSYISWSRKFNAIKSHYIKAHFPRYNTYFNKLDKLKNMPRTYFKKTIGSSTKISNYSSKSEDVKNKTFEKKYSDEEINSSDKFTSSVSMKKSKVSTNAENILKSYKALDKDYSDEAIGSCVKFITRWIKSAIFSGKIFESFENLILTISNEMIDSPLTYTEIYIIVVVSHLANINTVGYIPHILEAHALEDDFYKKLNHTCFWLREFLEGPFDLRSNIWTQYDEDKKFGPLLGGRESKIALYAALQFFPQKLNGVFTTNLNGESMVSTSAAQCLLVPNLFNVKEEIL